MSRSRGEAGKHGRGASVVLATSFVLAAACGNPEVPEAAFGRTLPSPWLVTRSVETRGLASPDRVVVRFSRERIERIDESGAVEIVLLDEPFVREGNGWVGKSSRLEMSAEEGEPQAGVSARTTTTQVAFDPRLGVWRVSEKRAAGSREVVFEELASADDRAKAEALLAAAKGPSACVEAAECCASAGDGPLAFACKRLSSPTVCWNLVRAFQGEKIACGKPAPALPSVLR
jgi:hypothetical protein